MQTNEKYHQPQQKVEKTNKKSKNCRRCLNMHPYVSRIARIFTSRQILRNLFDEQSCAKTRSQKGGNRMKKLQRIGGKTQSPHQRFASTKLNCHCWGSPTACLASTPQTHECVCAWPSLRRPSPFFHCGCTTCLCNVHVYVPLCHATVECPKQCLMGSFFCTPIFQLQLNF